MNFPKPFLALVSVLAIAGCASNREWASTAGNRDEGIVKVSYRYAQFQQPTLSDSEAEQIAENRCNVWGYADADFIPGLVRECSETDAGSCKVWMVTREYQCSGAEAIAARKVNGAAGTRFAPLQVAR